MKTAVAYIRVSTDTQLEYSPESQLKLIKDYAAKNGFILSEIYSDEGISGRAADKRPAFKRMIADAKAKRFDAIIIYSTSRFARNHEESVVYRSMLKREGIDVLSITQPSVDYKTDMLMNALYAVMDERYSIELGENVKRGLKEKVSRGLYVATIPFGYTRTAPNLPLIPHETEAPVVKWIFEQFLGGKSLGYLTQRVNGMGYLTRHNNRFITKNIRGILKNPTYKGSIRWTCDGETYSFDDVHEAIISAEQYADAQILLEERKEKYMPKTRDPIFCKHWLNGIIRCPQCGSTYIHVMGHNGRSNRYRCGRACRGGCENKRSVKVSEMEQAVLLFLRKCDWDTVVFSDRNQSGDTLKDMSVNTREKLTKSLERAKDAYLQRIDTIDEYKRNKENILSEMDKLDGEVKVRAVPARSDIEQRFNSIYDELTSNKDNSYKNDLIKSLIEKIVIDHDTHKLMFHLYT